MWPVFVLLGLALLAGMVMPAAVKAGVVLEGVNLEHMAPAVSAVERVWSGFGAQAVITDAWRDPAVDDGRHSRGDALDFRIKNLDRTVWERAGRAVAAQLHPALYDVVLEIDERTPTSSAANRSHLHIEWDPQPAKLTRATAFSIVHL